MLPFLRLSGIVSTLVRLGVIALVALFIIQQFGQVSFLGSLSPYDVYQVAP
jgi:hypothetical protein